MTQVIVVQDKRGLCAGAFVVKDGKATYHKQERMGVPASAMAGKLDAIHYVAGHFMDVELVLHTEGSILGNIALEADAWNQAQPHLVRLGVRMPRKGVAL